MLQVGLTGGIGSGKSEVARRLRERGAVVIDSDVLAREVVAPGSEGLAAVVGHFGPDLVGPDGSLDREAMARRVFADPAQRQALESIVHPLVRHRAAALAAAAPADSVVVHDIPLLVETGRAGDFDLVVVVDAPESVQVTRLTQVRGLRWEEAEARIAAQASREQRLEAADHVVRNVGTLADLDDAVDRLWAVLRERAS